MSWCVCVGEHILPEPVVSGPDENGIKTVVKYEINEEGKKVKITQRFRVSKRTKKVNTRVVERRSWPKFGKCKGVGPGPERGITGVSDEVTLDLTPLAERAKETAEDNDALTKKLAGTSIKCRLCQGEHFTSRCPYRDEIESRMGTEGGYSDAGAGSSGGGNGKSSYVPPHLRGDRANRGAASMEEEITTTLRVSNLSEDATEDDLRDLFSRFGHLQRVYLARNRNTKESRGFAFISFSSRRDAEAAKERVDGLPYGYLILAVDWARPSRK